MSDFKYFSHERVYNEIYYQFPKAFIESDTYRKLSDGAKIAYMLLKSRLDYALMKNWRDEDGHVFFQFTNNELQEMLNCGSQKVSHLKKELEAFNLLKQQRMGFNKQTGKNEKNRLYLAELDVTEKDVYLMQKRDETLGNSGLVKITSQSKSSNQPETLDNSGLVKITYPQKNDEPLDNSGLVNFKQVFNNNLDTNRHLIDTDKDDLQDQLLLNNFVEIMKDDSIATFIPEKVLNLIRIFSPSYADAQQTVRTIHNAKRKAEQLSGVTIVFEDLDTYGIETESRLYNTLLKAYQKQKTEKVGNIQNLIFAYSKNWFVEYVCAAIKTLETDQTLPKVSMVNWLQETKNHTQRSES